jgi:hypothetical protein
MEYLVSLLILAACLRVMAWSVKRQVLTKARRQIKRHARALNYQHPHTPAGGVPFVGHP